MQGSANLGSTLGKAYNIFFSFFSFSCCRNIFAFFFSLKMKLDHIPDLRCVLRSNKSLVLVLFLKKPELRVRVLF